MKLLLITFLMTFSFFANAYEIHVGLNVTHIWSSTYEDDHGVEHKYNEKNNLVIAFDDEGRGIGFMKNSYGKPSPMVLKKFEERKDCGFTRVFAKKCYAALVFGTAFNYTDVNKTGVLPVLAGGFKMKNGEFSLNTSIFNGWAFITTAAYEF